MLGIRDLCADPIHGSVPLTKGWRMADHNGSTDVSTTPLLGVLDTNHHVSHVCMYPDPDPDPVDLTPFFSDFKDA